MSGAEEEIVVGSSPPVEVDAPVGDLNETRHRIALLVVGVYALTIGVSLLSVFTHDSESMLSLLERLLPAESAVVASLMGFYFLERRGVGR
jgi:hypothetical protein